MLRVRAEVMIKLIAKFCSLRCGECSYVVKNIITF